MRKIIATIACLTLALGAFAQNNVTSDSLGFRTAAAGNVAELLRGQISGVRVSSIDGNPVGGLNVNIRGINSLRTDNQPLWIVDGVMVSTELDENLDAFWQYGEMSYTAPLNPLAFLNAAEIESIEVLKDISATTIYGARGANGVIIVKTRMPKSGEGNIHWTSNFGVATDASAQGLGAGFNHNHYLSFNGTKSNTAYNISGTFRDIKGTLEGNGSQYGSVKANFDTRANKILWFGLNAIMSVGASSSPTGVTYLGRPSMTLAMRDAALSPGTTPAQWAEDYDDDTKDYRALASTWVRVNLLPSLYFKASGGIDFQNNRRVIWYGLGTEFGAASASNQYGGAASLLASQLIGLNGTAELNFNRYFGTDHHVSASVAGEVVGNMNRFNTMNGINFVTHTLRGNGLKVGAYDVLIHTFRNDYIHYGAYARLSYDYKGMAGLNIAYRADNTPKYLGEEFHTYPSVEVYADLHKALLDGRDDISALKVKAGYGRSGKEKYVPYQLFGSYLSGGWFEPAEGTSTFYDGLNTLETAEWYATLEASALSGRINAAFTYFDRSTDDVFKMYQMGHSPGSGVNPTWIWDGCSQVFERLTTVRNRGYEWDIDAIAFQNSDWTVKVGANLSYMANTVTGYDPADFHGRKVGSNIFCTCNGLGIPVSSLYGYNVDGTGALVDETQDGRVDEADMVLLGTTIPTVYGGFKAGATFRDFSFEVLLDGAAGHDIANLNALVKDGAKDPYGVTVLTDKFVEKGDYLRLSQIGVSYKIPATIKYVKSLEARASVHNVATFSGYSGWNPDVNCFGVSPLSNGMDYGSYPQARLFLLGITAKF